MLLAVNVHVDLGHDRLDVVGLLDGRVDLRGTGDALDRAARLGAIADLIVGHEQHRLGGRAGLGGADRLGQVASGQRARVGMVGLQPGHAMAYDDVRADTFVLLVEA
jgi:hypothetical protein